MRDESAIEIIENSFQIGRNHSMIQQRLVESIQKIRLSDILHFQDKCLTPSCLILILTVLDDDLTN